MSTVPELAPADPRVVRELVQDVSDLLNQVATRVDMMAGHGNLAVGNLARAAQQDLTMAFARLASFVGQHQAPEMLPLGEMARRVLRDW